MLSNNVYICINCRIAFKKFIIQCPKCRNQMKIMEKKWRAPKKNNIDAWNQIAKGKIWWDKKAIEKKAKKSLKQIRKSLTTKGKM
jgi:predicted ATP-dependent serine protease